MLVDHVLQVPFASSFPFIFGRISWWLSLLVESAGGCHCRYSQLVVVVVGIVSWMIVIIDRETAG